MVYTFPMQQIQMLFVDCDGVLYNATDLTYEEMIQACQRAGQELGIHWDDVVELHHQLKAQGIHGWYNTTLELCRRYHVDFGDVAELMVSYVDYSKIPEDLELLELLQRMRQKKDLVLLTNNTRPHVEKIFDRLFHKSIKQTKLRVLTVEDTLWDHYFHVKQQPGAFGVWCQKFHVLPEQVLLLDDTENVLEVAKSQGLQTIQTLGPEMIKKVLKGFL